MYWKNIVKSSNFIHRNNTPQHAVRKEKDQPLDLHHTGKRIRTFCLANCKQQLKPNPQEKIALAKIGLEIKCLLFNLEGNAHHVHDMIMKEWPILEKCGGYTLHRLAENSHSH